MKLPSGKWAGQTYQQVYDHHRDYVNQTYTTERQTRHGFETSRCSVELTKRCSHKPLLQMLFGQNHQWPRTRPPQSRKQSHHKAPSHPSQPRSSSKGVDTPTTTPRGTGDKGQSSEHQDRHQNTRDEQAGIRAADLKDESGKARVQARLPCGARSCPSTSTSKQLRPTRPKRSVTEEEKEIEKATAYIQAKTDPDDQLRCLTSEQEHRIHQELQNLSQEIQDQLVMMADLVNPVTFQNALNSAPPSSEATVELLENYCEPTSQLTSQFNLCGTRVSTMGNVL